MENTFATAQPIDQPPRVLALDFGARNIGLAVSDELGVTAQGLPTLRRSNKRNDLDHLRRVIKQFQVAELVMGLPLRMSGDEGIQSEKVQVFAEELRRKFKMPVHLFAGIRVGALICDLVGVEGTSITVRRQTALDIGGFHQGMNGIDDREFLIRASRRGRRHLIAEPLWEKYSSDDDPISGKMPD